LSTSPTIESTEPDHDLRLTVQSEHELSQNMRPRTRDSRLLAGVPNVPIGGGREATPRHSQTVLGETYRESFTCGVWLLPSLACGSSSTVRLYMQVSEFRDHPTNSGVYRKGSAR
jgi:hypothetical protein